MSVEVADAMRLEIRDGQVGAGGWLPKACVVQDGFERCIELSSEEYFGLRKEKRI